MIHEVIRLLKEQKAVGLIQGASEAGARALGNRSILFDPRNPKGKDLVNKIKQREYFRPFGASCLHDKAEEYVDMYPLKESPYMLYAFPVKEEKKNIIPAVVHVDGTCRMQTVKKEDNKILHTILSGWYQETNVPVLLNTSLNAAGEPLAYVPLDAFIDNLDYIYFADDKKILDRKNDIKKT